MGRRGSKTRRVGTRRRRLLPRPTPKTRFRLAVFLPIAVSLFSQFEFIQQSTCVLAELPWGIGRCDVLADLIAPLWALAIIPVAARLRRIARRYGSAPENPEGWLIPRFATQLWVDRATRLASAGAVLILLFGYTREWDRFGQRPDAVWYSMVIIATLLLLLIPLWWIRAELHTRGVRYLSEGRLPQWIDRFLFSEADGLPPRWPAVLAFAGVSFVVAFTLLGQFDSLLLGMHLPDDPSTGIGGLSGTFEFDLRAKPDLVIERVQAWRDYSLATGAEFGSGYSIVVGHVLIDALVRIPAYSIGIVTLVLYAWRHRSERSDASIRRGFELFLLTALVVAVFTVAFDLLKMFFTWYVMDRAWEEPSHLTNANVRMLWFSALVRAIGLAMLTGIGFLMLALAERGQNRTRRALIAVRSEILLLVVFAVVVLMFPQTADVIRGWRMSHTVITVGLAVALSMLIRWTSAANLRLQERQRISGEGGEPPTPRRLRIPFTDGATTSLLRAAGLLIVTLAVVQLVVSATTGLQIGRGLLVPAGIVVVLWLAGVALPPARFVRGDRPVSFQVRRRVPRLLGAAVYLILGGAILKAAAAAVAYARHDDWYLLFAVVPPLIGMWRIGSRTTHSMDHLEVVFAVGATVLAAVVIAVGNPELSPTALIFTGVTFAYGSLAYFHSYESTSAVSRFSKRYLSRSWAQPVVIGAAISLFGTLIWFYVDPIGVGPVIGTVGMIVMAMMAMTMIGAGGIRFAELTEPPRVLAAFGIKRMPVVVFLVLWIALAPTVIDQSTNDVRVIHGQQASVAGDGDDFSRVWQRWADRNLATSDGGGDAAEGRQAVPLLLISSSGGGLRAATWTSFVLDCLFEAAPASTGPCADQRSGPSQLPRVAAMSGVSGGALGLAEYVTHVVDDIDGEEADTWVDEVLGDDYLAAPIGWLFFADLPRSLIGFGAGISNRSEVMERAWEASWPESVPGLGRGIAELWASHPEIPPLFFNGTSVNDACRFNVSALDTNGGSPDVPSCAANGREEGLGGPLAATYDLTDFLCEGDDLPLSTAASLVSRFPFVSVSGRITADPDRDCDGRRDGTVFVVDGGYLEGSGSGTLLDVWEGLAGFVEEYNSMAADSCVVPFMVHIDNGYESPSVSGNEAVPREFLVPLLATASTSSGITAARAEAALEFEQPFSIGGSKVGLVIGGDGSAERIESRYARLVTRAHPGVQAPLGWTLSQASIDDLRDQLAIAENSEAFAEIRTWLDGDVRCTEE